MINKKIMENYEKLCELRERSTTRFPARVSFAIVRNIKTLQSIYEDIIAVRLEILQKYGDPADEPGYFSPKIGKEKVMKEELDSIDKAETPINQIQYISFSDIENLDLSIADMDALSFMVDG